MLISSQQGSKPTARFILLWLLTVNQIILILENKIAQKLLWVIFPISSPVQYRAQN
jgi:hypothetical protein